MNQPPSSVCICWKVPVMTPPEGAGNGVKLAALVEVPPGVVTAIGPAVASAGTTAVICAGEFTVKLAFMPLKVTAVAPLKFLPVMIIEAPTTPLAGMASMTGGGVAAPEGITFRFTGDVTDRLTVIQSLWLAVSRVA